MINKENIREIVEGIFECSKLKASEADVQLLAKKMLSLEERCLSQLNWRLISCNSKISDTLAEIDFAYELICHLPSIPVLYEPAELNDRTLKRPPDFVIQKNGTTFWIQMKNLSQTERENRQAKNIAGIQKLAQTIKINKFYWCCLSEKFNKSDVRWLIDHISKITSESFDDGDYLYLVQENEDGTVNRSVFIPISETESDRVDNDEFWTLDDVTYRIRAKISFFKPRQKVFQHLTLGGSQDLTFLKVTGESKDHILRSLTNAVGAFDWDIDAENINLIAMKSSNFSHHNIDVGEALFGDEEWSCSLGYDPKPARSEGGFFNNPNVYSKAAGVIIFEPVEGHLIGSKYNKLLFINKKFIGKLEQICSIINPDKIIGFKDYIE